MNTKFIIRKELYESGVSTNKIAKMLDITPRAVLNSLNKMGVNIRSSRESLTINTPKNEIVNDYKSGLSCSKIAKKYNRSITGISNILKLEGINVLRPEDTTTYNWSFIYNNSNLFMYWLGWMLSDGCIYHCKAAGRNRGIMTYLCTNDKYILEFFRDKIDKARKVVTKGKNNKMYRLDISIPRKDAEFISQFGLIEAKSLVIKGTDKLVNLSRNDFIQMFAGLIEGDGDIKFQQMKSKLHTYPVLSIRLHSGSKEWLEFISNKLDSFGYKKRKILGPRKHYTDFGGTYNEKREYISGYSYSISGKDAINLGKEILNCKYHLLDRKWNKVKEAINFI